MTKKGSTAKKSTVAPKKVNKPKKLATPDPLDENMSLADFINKAYLSLLGREADKEGVAHYTKTVELHKRPRSEILDALKMSKEYRKA